MRAEKHPLQALNKFFVMSQIRHPSIQPIRRAPAAPLPSARENHPSKMLTPYLRVPPKNLTKPPLYLTVPRNKNFSAAPFCVILSHHRAASNPPTPYRPLCSAVPACPRCPYPSLFLLCAFVPLCASPSPRTAKNPVLFQKIPGCSTKFHAKSPAISHISPNFASEHFPKNIFPCGADYQSALQNKLLLF